MTALGIIEKSRRQVNSKHILGVAPGIEIELHIFGELGDNLSGSATSLRTEGLKACPFCNSAELEICNTHTPSYWVACIECGGECGGKAPRYKTIATLKKAISLHRAALLSAIEAWNRRAA